VNDLVTRHRLACDGFSAIVQQADGHWDSPSPCPEWDARAVVEHVIGFHDVLLLRPLDAKPERPKGEPSARWAITVLAIFSVLGRPTEDLKINRLLPALTSDVLVHTWDLAMAVGVVPRLDPDLCSICCEFVLPNDRQLRESGMFAPAFEVPGEADAATRLVAFLGRDPAWTWSDHTDRSQPK
jgi:uncharacterized protein (TIGR03083 family)